MKSSEQIAKNGDSQSFVPVTERVCGWQKKTE